MRVSGLYLGHCEILKKKEACMRLYGRDHLWNPNQFDFVRVVSIQNPLAQVKILTKTRPCQSKEAVAETCSRDLLPGMFL